jgi:hypothetical protein
MGSAWRPGGAGGMGQRGQLCSDQGHARKEEMADGPAVRVGLGGTVEPGSAQDRTKISFFNISTSSSLKILKVALLVLQKFPNYAKG